MADWFICNKCYRGVTDSMKPFTLTQCEHIFCRYCMVTEPPHKGIVCPGCKSSNVPTISLSESHDSTNFGSWMINLMDQMAQVDHVQQTQKSMLLQRFNHMELQYERMKESYRRKKKELALIVSATEKLKEKLSFEQHQLKIYQEQYEITLKSRTPMILSASKIINSSKLSHSSKTRHDDQRREQQQQQQLATTMYNVVEQELSRPSSSSVTYQVNSKGDAIMNRVPAASTSLPTCKKSAVYRMTERDSIVKYYTNRPETQSSFVPRPYRVEQNRGNATKHSLPSSSLRRG